MTSRNVWTTPAKARTDAERKAAATGQGGRLTVFVTGLDVDAEESPLLLRGGRGRKRREQIARHRGYGKATAEQ